MLTRGLASLGLKLAGWQFEGTPPPDKKYVFLAVPHTSNWDALLLVLLAQSVDLRMEWMIKGEWLKGPLAPLLRRVGALPIDRSRSHDMVAQMIAQFQQRDEMVLAIPPEGTRRRAEHWKSGFYHIALGAGVPVVPGFLDFGKKRGGLGPAYHLTGDVRADMDRIRAFYAARDLTAHVPANFGPIRLREETAT